MYKKGNSDDSLVPVDIAPPFNVSDPTASSHEFKFHRPLILFIRTTTPALLMYLAFTLITSTPNPFQSINIFSILFYAYACCPLILICNYWRNSRNAILRIDSETIRIEDGSYQRCIKLKDILAVSIKDGAARKGRLMSGLDPFFYVNITEKNGPSLSFNCFLISRNAFTEHPALIQTLAVYGCLRNYHSFFPLERRM